VWVCPEKLRGSGTGYGTELEHLVRATVKCDDPMGGRETLVRRRGGTELGRARWR
jgi:hypothetical protein